METQAPNNNCRADKVLIVDDNHALLEAVAELFQTADYQTLMASNGEQALECLHGNNDITVLFTDVGIPDMNGVELAHKARALLPDLKVILVSGYAKTELKMVGLEQFPFLAKPYLFSEVKALLQSL